MSAPAAAGGGRALPAPAVRPGYRRRLAAALPAVQLAYLLLVWPLVYARGIVPADLAAGPVAPAEPFLLNRLFFPAMAAIAFLLLAAEWQRLGRFRTGAFFLVAALFGWFGLTALWALAPPVALSKFLLLAIQTAGLVAAVLLAPRTRDVVAPLFWVLALAVAVNLPATLLLPPTPIGHAGIYPHKNMLGSVAALAGIFALYGVTQRGRMRAAALLMLTAVPVLLYASQSKTALGLFLIAPPLALAALVAQRWLRLSMPLMLAVAAPPAAFLLAGGAGGGGFRAVSAAITGDGTFTGRTELWDFALAAIAQRPLAGYGYQSFWDVGPASPAAALPDSFVSRTPHAHNGYLDLLLQGGGVALALFSALLLLVAGWAGRLGRADPGLAFLAAAMLFYLLLHNVLETAWMQGLSAPGMLASLLILLAATIRSGDRPA